MRPLDFQDLLWGFTVQDTCISLADMERSGVSAAARAAFESGYRTIRPRPETDPDLVAALLRGARST